MTGNYNDIPYPPDYGAPHAITPTPTPALDLDALEAHFNEWLTGTEGERYFGYSIGETDLRALIAAARETASLRTQLAEANARAESWRCFHCDEVFTTREEAAAHFGYSECSAPACRVDGGLASAYREFEGRWSRCQNECCDHLNAYYAKRSEHNQALIREEEHGYAKGVADMRDQLADANARADKAETERDEAVSDARGIAETNMHAAARIDGLTIGAAMLRSENADLRALIEKAVERLNFHACKCPQGDPCGYGGDCSGFQTRALADELTAAIGKGEGT